MLYIMRHGRTDWNDLHKLQGRTDIPLNAQGLQMAREAAQRYKDVHFDVCYTSPLRRALTTAEILLEGRDVPIIPDERLCEMCFGVFEGVECVIDRKIEPMYTFFKHPELYTTPAEGAESLAELFARTGAFLEETVQPLLDFDMDVLIVGHGAMNSSIVCRRRHLPVSEFWSAGIENCKLMELP